MNHARASTLASRVGAWALIALSTSCRRSDPGSAPDQNDATARAPGARDAPHATAVVDSGGADGEVDGRAPTPALPSAVDATGKLPPHLTTGTPYRPQQDPSTYEPPPSGFAPVYTQLVARHGSRGLSKLAADLLVSNMWQKAKEEGALTPLGEKLGPDVERFMKAHFTLGYGVEGITKPGYGNESQRGIDEHKGLAVRMLRRLSTLFEKAGDPTATASRPRQVVVVTSGVDRAVDSANYFVGSLVATQPNLEKLVTRPPGPAGYPAGAPVKPKDGTNRFLLYFHKLVPATDLVTDARDPGFQTYQDSQAYQAYLSSDPDLAAKQHAAKGAAVKRAARAVLSRLFAKAFVDKLEDGTLTFTNTGSRTFSTPDGKLSQTLSGDGKDAIKGVVDGAIRIYELYVLGPAMASEAGVDFSPYLPAEDAERLASVNDAAEFYRKGPGIAEKGDATYRVAQVLLNDFFDEVDAVSKGDLSHVAKLRFAHAEIIMPFSALLHLKHLDHPVPLAKTYAYETNPWRTEVVSPMTANVQWDVYGDGKSGLLVKMLYNERETEFRAECDGAKVSPKSFYYDYGKLRACHGGARR